jgi:hypothetical protein
MPTVGNRADALAVQFKRSSHGGRMEAGHIPFFTVDENRAAMRGLLLNLPPPSTPTDGEVPFAFRIRKVVEVLLADAQNADQSCQLNIKWIGSTFLSEVKSYPPDVDRSAEQLAKIFTSLYRFLCELHFSMPGGLGFDLNKAKGFVDENLTSFSEAERRELVFANYIIPSEVVRRLIHHPDLDTMREFNRGQPKVIEQKKQWDKELAEKEARVISLMQQLAWISTAQD